MAPTIQQISSGIDGTHFTAGLNGLEYTSVCRIYSWRPGEGVM
jgi:hypothetical protein